MTIRVAVPKEKTGGERRVSAVPETANRLVKKGFEVLVESGAGEGANNPDEAYEKAGAKIVKDARELLTSAQVILKVRPPEAGEISLLKPGTVLVGFLFAHEDPGRVKLLRDRKATFFAMELIPRVTRAQSMDALSSQATVAGYKSVLLAANLAGRFFPMLTTAAGTVRPAKVLILGVGVAGLMAIATARRLGAIVSAYDVRRAVKEQVQSLGARFLETEVDAEAHGGYARELTEEEKLRQRELVSAHVSRADVVITTAQIPGKKAPRLVTEEMVSAMKPGSVIVDLAAESGGNCALTKPGCVVCQNGVMISGPLNLPGELAVHASEMYSKNILNFLLLATMEGQSLEPDFNDEIIAGSVVTHHGEILHEGVKRILEEAQ